MEQIDGVILELYKFSDKILTLGAPLNDTIVLDSFEYKHRLELPYDYKLFLLKHNGLELMGVQVYGFGYPEDIDTVYEFEHHQVIFPQYDYLVPFSPDGSGNFYCFDTRKHINKSCPIVFWVSNYEYNEHDQPEITNESFTDWLREVVIEWTLEDYDYDGSNKQF
jgi:hypothetical protein